MLTRRLACPSCGAGLKVATTLPAGKKINCPKCEESFRIPEEEDDEAPPPKAKAAARKPAPRDDEDDYEGPAPKSRKRARDEEDDYEDDEPEERPRPAKKRRKAKPAGSSLPLILGLVIGGLVLIGGGVTAAILLLKDDKPSGPVASGSGTRGVKTGEMGSENRGTEKTGEPKGGGGGDQIAAGLSVYEKNNCARCHSTGAGGGGGFGGGKGKGRQTSLAGVGSRRSVDYLMEHVRDAKSHTPGSRMPRYGEKTIPEKDLRALAEYLASLK